MLGSATKVIIAALVVSTAITTGYGCRRALFDIGKPQRIVSVAVTASGGNAPTCTFEVAVTDTGDVVPLLKDSKNVQDVIDLTSITKNSVAQHGRPTTIAFQLNEVASGPTVYFISGKNVVDPKNSKEFSGPTVQDPSGKAIRIVFDYENSAHNARKSVPMGINFAIDDHVHPITSYECDPYIRNTAT